MNEKITKLTSKLNLKPGAPKELLKKIELELGISLPLQYVEFMRRSNGAEGDVGNSYLTLWPVEEIIPLNKAYAVEEFAPGLLLIGSDGGDIAYAFDTRLKSMPIVKVPFIGMDLREVKLCGATLIEFLENLYDQTE